MNRQQPTNLPASVHQRLLNLSQVRGEDFNFLLARYVIERLLYRLSRSAYADSFVLKGALLFLIWKLPIHRPTRDIDLLGYGDRSTQQLARIFRKICLVDIVEDGITFDPATVSVRPIREGQRHGGQRITLTAYLGRARILTQIDLGWYRLGADCSRDLDFSVTTASSRCKRAVICCQLDVEGSVGCVVIGHQMMGAG